MLIEYPEYYNRFRCIADRCPDTCCAGWEVDVDEDMYYYYKVVPGKIGEKIRSHMVENGEEKYFPLTKEGRCPFLDRQGLCEIYSQLGEESLCRVCTEYPRYYMEIGNYEQIDLSVSCMELGRILFSSADKITYERIEDPADGEEISGKEQELLDNLLKGRNEAIALAQDRSLPLSERQSRAGIMTERSADSYAALFPLLHRLEVLGEGWTEILDQLEARKEKLFSLAGNLYSLVPGMELWMEKMTAYLIWRYWIDGWFEEDPVASSSRRLISRSLQLTELMCALRLEQNGSTFTLEDMVDIAHIFSRQVEHSDENVDLMKLQASAISNE